jgi:hypothetical protein
MTIDIDTLRVLGVAARAEGGEVCREQTHVFAPPIGCGLRARFSTAMFFRPADDGEALLPWRP